MNETTNFIGRLQELGAKAGYLPKYDEISAINGTHQNEFVYRVKYNDLATNGRGPNKKLAKQNAAMAMLHLLKNGSSNDYFHNPVHQISNNSVSTCRTETNVISQTSTEIYSISTNSSTTNYIGKLQEYCASKRILDPSYEVVNTEGQPHKFVFTVSCKACSHYVEARASTKKQAKQLAAKEMLKLIPNWNGQLDAPLNNHPRSGESSDDATLDKLGVRILNLEIDPFDFSLSERSQNAKDLYKAMRTSNRETETVPISDYHNYFKNNYQDSVSLEAIRSIMDNLRTCDKHNINVTLVTKLIKEICPFEIGVINVPIVTHPTRDGILVIGFQLNSTPKIVEMGNGKTQHEAEVTALLNTLQTIADLLA